MSYLETIREFPTPDVLVAGAGEPWPLRQLWETEKFLPKSLHELCREAAGPNAPATKAASHLLMFPLRAFNRVVPWRVSVSGPESGFESDKEQVLCPVPRGAIEANSVPDQDTANHTIRSANVTGLILQLLSKQARAITPAEFLAWELILLHVTGQDLTERILGRVAKAESKESDVWRADDLRVSWLCVLFAARGNPCPWDLAFVHYYGKPLKKALKAWAERDQQNQRIFRKIELAALPPKKSPVSENPQTVEREGEA